MEVIKADAANKVHPVIKEELERLWREVVHREPRNRRERRAAVAKERRVQCKVRVK